jgi:hypothetical protein
MFSHQSQPSSYVDIPILAIGVGRKSYIFQLNPDNKADAEPLEFTEAKE